MNLVMELMTGGEVIGENLNFSYSTESLKKNITLKEKLLILSDPLLMQSDMSIQWESFIET
jgi:hypothetical protein